MKVDLAQGIFFLMLKTKFSLILMEGKHSQDEAALFMACGPQKGNMVPTAPLPTKSCSDLPSPQKVLPL